MERGGGKVLRFEDWGLTVVGDGGQDLGLDVLEGETLPGAGDGALGRDGLCRKERDSG